MEKHSKPRRWPVALLVLTMLVGAFALAGWRASTATEPRFVSRHPHEYVPHDDHEVGTYTDGYRVRADFSKLVAEAQREMPASEWQFSGSVAGGTASFRRLPAKGGRRSFIDTAVLMTRKGGTIDIIVVRYDQISLVEKVQRWLKSLF
jgi:hypothetical protein